MVLKHRPRVATDVGGGEGGRVLCLGFTSRKKQKQNKQTTTITEKMGSNYDYLQYKKIILIETFTRYVLAKLYEIALLVCQQRLNIDDFI